MSCDVGAFINRRVPWKLVVVAFLCGVLLREVFVNQATVVPQRGQSGILDDWDAADNATMMLDVIGDSASHVLLTNVSEPTPLVSISASQLENDTQLLSQWVDTLLTMAAASGQSIVDNVCHKWTDLADGSVRSAQHVVLMDHVSIYDALPGGINVKRLSSSAGARPLPFPTVSPLDLKFGCSKRFRHRSKFKRYFGVFDKDASKATYPQWTRADGPFFVAALPNAFLTFRDHVLLCNDNTVGMHLASCLRDGHLLRRKQVSRSVMVPPVFPTVAVGIPLCSKGTCRWGGPFHLIVEHLARIAPLVGLLMSRNDTFLVATGDPSDIEPLVYRYLAMMGVPKNKVVLYPTGVRARYLLYTPAVCFRPLPFALQMLRVTVFRTLKIATEFKPRKLIVFAERMQNKGSWRIPGNYPLIKRAITALCDHLGILYTTVTDVGREATVRAFATADVVVGVHGANLSPVVFMPHGAALVELLARHLHPMCFYHTGAMLGVRRYPIFYDFPHFHDAPASVSVMHVLEQVVKAMRVAPSAWMTFLLLEHANRDPPLLQMDSVPSGKPLTCPGRGDATPRLHASRIISDNSRLRMAMVCDNHDAGGGGAVGRYLCADLDALWNCTEVDQALDLVQHMVFVRFTEGGVQVNVSDAKGRWLHHPSWLLVPHFLEASKLKSTGDVLVPACGN